MKNRKLIKSNIGRKFLALGTASAILASCLGPWSLEAVNATSSDDSGQTTETTTESSADSSSKEEVVEEEDLSNVMEPTMGSVMFWEWEKLGDYNYVRLLGDGKFHASLFKVSGRNTFISTYADDEHIFLPQNTGYNSEMADKGYDDLRYAFNKTEYDAAVNALGVNAGVYDQYRSMFLRADDDGKNKIPSSLPNKFFTNQGCMGCLWVKYGDVGEVQTGDNDVGLEIALTPSKCKNDPLSTAYLNVGYDKLNDRFLYVRKSVEGDGEKSEPVFAMRDSYINDLPDIDRFEMDVTTNYSAGSKAAYGGIYIHNERDKWDGGLDYDGKSYYTDLNLTTNGWIIPVIDTLNVGNRFECVYIGTPHSFNTLESQRVDEGKMLPITNSTTIDANENISNVEGAIIPNGEVITVDGTLVVSGNLINNGKIKINKGGLLLVKEGGCVSPYSDLAKGSGVIENDGGTIIIMEGGRIYCMTTGSPADYTTTNSPLILTSGGTVINYGLLAVSKGMVGEGSKIEVRKNGGLFVGYVRQDEMTMMYNTSAIGTSNGNGTSWSVDNLGAFNPMNIIVYEFSDIKIVSNEKGPKHSVKFTYKGKRYTLYLDKDDYSQEQADKTIDPQLIIKGFINTHYREEINSMIFGLGLQSYESIKKPTVVVESTAYLNGKTSEEADYASSSMLNIIVPEY
ncbi:MAG: hypothetical protein K6E10_10795 [Eubacterium sp.]|nr:hypothetical protein [Eubacterium sp.]